MLHGLPRQFAQTLSRFTASLKHVDQARWLTFVILFAILTNIPFWAASRWVGLLPLGWFCVEYAGVGLLALVVPRTLTIILLFLAIAGDLISAVSKTYYLAPTECLFNLGSMHEFPTSRLFAVAAVVVILLILLAAAFLFPVVKMRKADRLRAAGCLLAFAAVAITADYTSMIAEAGHLTNPFRSSRQSDAKRFSYFNQLWLGRYPAIRLVRSEAFFGNYLNANIRPSDALPATSAAALAWRSAGLDVNGNGNTQPRPNLVVILLESWGLDLDLFTRNALVRPYSQPELLSRYEVSQGTVPFYGSTVAGETRELCSSRIGSQVTNVPAQGLHGCLPDQLASLGYHTIALHGMDGHLFRRSKWYGTIGFQERWFRDRFRRQGLPDCAGVFPGTCDAAIAEWTGQRLQKKDADPDFVYWVTLNSHLPVPVPSALPNGAPCSITALLAEQPALCSWYQLVFNVHESVARLAMTSLARPTIFVIVGDHAPPFVDPLMRSQFSSAEVPYIVLLPRVNPRIQKRAAD